MEKGPSSADPRRDLIQRGAEEVRRLAAAGLHQEAVEHALRVEAARNLRRQNAGNHGNPGVSSGGHNGPPKPYRGDGYARPIPTGRADGRPGDAAPQDAPWHPQDKRHQTSGRPGIAPGLMKPPKSPASEPNAERIIRYYPYTKGQRMSSWLLAVAITAVGAFAVGGDIRESAKEHSISSGCEKYASYPESAQLGIRIVVPGIERACAARADTQTEQNNSIPTNQQPGE